MPPVEIHSVVHLTNMARRYLASALAPEFLQSQPIPVPGPKALRVAFLFGKGMIIEPGEGLQLMPPSYLGFLNAVTGDVEELRAVTPGELGQKHKEEELIGRYLTLPERMMPEFLTKQARLQQVYDTLLPAFAGLKPGDSAEVKRAAGEFKTLFAQVSEGPWLPYYQAVGKQFFAWLEKAGA
jgi:hypothetical protein